MPVRVAYLGPAGTYSDDALQASIGAAEIERVPQSSIHEAIDALAQGHADRALVPFENSIEGTVRTTLDTLAFDAAEVEIVGSFDHPIHHSLITATELALGDIEVVISHPQASAQCQRYLRENLPAAEVRAALSTADAVRLLGESTEPWAALGAASAAEIYGCVVIAEGVEDAPDNVTRFIWIAPAGTATSPAGEWRTTLVFSELGEDHPGALVDALHEFSSRGVNLTRIESRPRRTQIGRYMFFVDVEGAASDEPLAGAITALRQSAESVRVLGSYPVGGPAPLA